MSLSLREHVRIALAASRVATVCVKPRWRGGAHEHHTAHYDSVAGETREERAAAALRTALEPVRARGRACSIVVSNTFARYVLLPWRDEIRHAQAREAYARAYLIQVYGASAADWTLTLDEGAYREPVAVCALPRALLESLRAVVSDCGMQLASLQPFLGAAFNRCRHKLREAAFWFGVVEPERICLAHVMGRSFNHLIAQRAGHDLGADLALMVARESLVIGSVAPQPLYLFAPGVQETAFAALRGLASESWLLPAGGDAQYAMALA